MAVVRAEVIQRIRKAFRAGQSQTSFIWEMRQKGLGYRNTTMISDWHAETGQAKVEGLIRFVRKDYYPSKAIIADKPYKLSHEFMYKAKVYSREQPDAPLKEDFFNLMSDVPLTGAMVEQGIIERHGRTGKSPPEPIEAVIPWTVIHRVLE
ncbi:hypothetical protein ES708_27284 [subsurface metagenome]